MSDSSEIRLKNLGPGMVIAATGLGAGDLIAAAVGGASFGMEILWVVALGAVLKFVLNEGVARWQLVTGRNVVMEMAQSLPSWVNTYFLLYLVLWTFVVGGALMSACGLAAYALFPQLGLIEWAIVHTVLATILVASNRYRLFEAIMKWFIGLMFIVVLGCAIAVKPDLSLLASGLFVPALPADSLPIVLGIIGGVGGSVTLLCYGYWIAQRQWVGPQYLRLCRLDLAVAYFFTGLFGLAIVIIAAQLSPEVMSGKKMALALAQALDQSLGEFAKWSFLVGFWAAVFSSMIGVWHGIPYLFADFVSQRKSPTAGRHGLRRNLYLSYLLFLATVPVSLLFINKPVWLIILYAMTGALFMPFLALLLLVFNNRTEMAQHRNSWMTNVGLLSALLLFASLFVSEVLKRLQGFL